VERGECCGEVGGERRVLWWNDGELISGWCKGWVWISDRLGVKGVCLVKGVCW
jgi:hypothetical protein